MTGNGRQNSSGELQTDLVGMITVTERRVNRWTGQTLLLPAISLQSKTTLAEVGVPSQSGRGPMSKNLICQTRPYTKGTSIGTLPQIESSTLLPLFHFWQHITDTNVVEILKANLSLKTSREVTIPCQYAISDGNVF